jgi:hypothetical protein
MEKEIWMTGERAYQEYTSKEVFPRYPRVWYYRLTLPFFDWLKRHNIKLID